MQLGRGGKASFSSRSQACGHENVADVDSETLTDDNSSDTSLGESHQESGIKVEDAEQIVNCPHCFIAWEVSEIKEHQKICPERAVKCHVCLQSITVMSYDEHMNIHYEEEKRKNAAQHEKIHHHG